MKNYSDFWQYLGTVWNAYDNKRTMEYFWEGLASGIDNLLVYEAEIQKSRSMEYMSPTFEIGPENFDLIYSGVNTDLINVTLNDQGTEFSFPVQEWTYSIPTLKYSYVYNGVTYTGTYTENVDYVISGHNAVHWIGALPSADPRYTSTIRRANLYAEHVYVINPILMNLWAVFAGFKYEYYQDYVTFGNDTFLHLKMLIWALVFKQLQSPSIKTLRDAFAISRGMPFAYSAGTASTVYSVDHYEVTIGDYTYVLPAGYTAIADGTVVEKFDLIASGVDVWDYNTNLPLVSEYSNPYNRRNVLVVDVKVTAGDNYNQTFHDAYMAKLLPKQLAWYQKGPFAMNSTILLFNNSTIFMNEN